MERLRRDLAQLRMITDPYVWVPSRAAPHPRKVQRRDERTQATAAPGTATKPSPRRGSNGASTKRLAYGFGNGRTIAWTAHDDEFRLAIGQLAVAEQPAGRRRARMSSSTVNFIPIIVRRSGALS